MSFLKGISWFAAEGEIEGFDQYGAAPAIADGEKSIALPADEQGIYQTMLVADALRYLTLQITAAKASGHPGGFASSAEVLAALWLLGEKNVITEVGHHAPGYYSATFLDGSLAKMGIESVDQFMGRFREKGGLLGHITGAIPGFLAPAGPLGQGQHFAMAAAYLNRNTLFPVTIGDGGFGEPYVMSAFGHFHTLYPEVSNYLPILIWNGFSQEHHSIVSRADNPEMIAFFKAYGFKNVILVDAKDHARVSSGSAPLDEAFVDSTTFPLAGRMAFTGAVIRAIAEARHAALSGTHTVVILKQLKGAGVHAHGAKSHNLYAYHSLESEDIVKAMKARALTPAAWNLVRTNMARAAGGPAAEVAVTEQERTIAAIEHLELTEFEKGGPPQVPTTAFGLLVGQVGSADGDFVVTNADGNQASGMMNINEKLGIRHPTKDSLYAQRPDGQVYEPLSEDACAGFAAGISLLGGRSLWISYESFVINGLPIWQTVTQAMAELRRPTPAMVALFTAGALEQGRNGWTHQRPEVEAYFAALMRNGNVFPLFPVDANMIQAAYDWALGRKNQGVAIFASKSPLPVRTSLDEGRRAVEEGAIILDEKSGSRTVVLAAAGDMVLGPVYDAAKQLHDQGIGYRIVSVVNPRRLFRPGDVLHEHSVYGDSRFVSDTEFTNLFGGDALVGVTGGATGVLEPLLLRATSPRDIMGWKRGETTASARELFELNRITGA
ncbi:MAG TPA: phosphoketolase, partial [Spirochaetia bacterium]|nr:phosphoketolase [Spirochaetia bacterium]